MNRNNYIINLKKEEKVIADDHHNSRRPVPGVFY